MKFLAKFSDVAYVMLRIATGFMFLFHGLQKIFDLWSDFHPPAGSQIWIGGLIELIGGIAVMIGFQTRLAAFLCSGTMAVAYTQFHWKFQLGRAFFPVINQGELAALYCFVFFYIACRGAVMASVDKK